MTKIPVVALIKRTDGMNTNVPGPYYTSSVVSPLDPVSPDLRGKWGIVITPSFYVMRWWMTHDSHEMQIEVLDDRREEQMIRGVKPLTSEKACSHAQALTPNSWSGYKFSVY